MMDKTEIRKANIYLASPFFNEEQIDRVERVENQLESNPFVEAYFSPMRNQIEQLTFGSPIWREAVFNQDVAHIDWCDAVVAVHDFEGDYVDAGTAWEVGNAYAKGKPIILIHEGTGNVNLMLSDSLHYYMNDVEELTDYNFLKMPSNQYEGDVI